jgi:hypothetical protein
VDKLKLLDNFDHFGSNLIKPYDILFWLIKNVSLNSPDYLHDYAIKN